jgi:hypothetical protein
MVSAAAHPPPRGDPPRAAPMEPTAGVTFRCYAGRVHGDESEVVRKIRAGRLDGGARSADTLAARDPRRRPGNP